MGRSKLGFSFALATTLMMAPAAYAQFAVIDAAAVTQLLSEVQTLQQELATTQSQLMQAQAEFQAMTGHRGMQSLLGNTVRNYLPPDWATLQSALLSTSRGASAYRVLAADVARAIAANSVLPSQQLSALPAAAAQSVQAARQSPALLQALTHEALANTSARFAALQELIDAIGTASDQKSILEVQARIAAEAGMLDNERTKLQDLYQAVQADQLVSAQRTRELIMAGHGQFANRFQPHP